jgi:hypothetical protein
MPTNTMEPRANALDGLMDAMELSMRERGFTPALEIIAQIEAVLPGVIRDNAPKSELPAEYIGDRIEEAIKAAESRLVRRVEIVQHGKATVTIEGNVHCQFEEARAWVSAKTDNGHPVPVWFYGAAGGGKSHLFRQLAISLGYTDYIIRGLGPTDTVSSIIGYVSQVTGKFMPGIITPELYGNGGFIALDEVCNADPSCLIGLNELIAGIDFRFPNGQLVKKSSNFILVVSDNTKGNGSTGGFIRNKPDLSSLTRFVSFEMFYDEDLEVALCGNVSWARYVQSVRKYFAGHANVPVYITPRASINGAALLKAGVKVANVCQGVLFTHCSADQKIAALKAVGEYYA